MDAWPEFRNMPQGSQWKLFLGMGLNRAGNGRDAWEINL